MPLCAYMEGGDHCPASGERRFMNDWRCPRHTPPAPDPAMGAAALRARADWPPSRDKTYGRASDTPRLQADGVTPMPPVETKPKGTRK